MGQNSAATWERALWKRTNIPDNHVPESFLSSLSTNGKQISLQRQHLVLAHTYGISANFRPYTYGYLVIASWSISQHLATIFIFIAVFVKLKERILDPRILVWVSIISFVTGYFAWEMLQYYSASPKSAPTNSP